MHRCTAPPHDLDCEGSCKRSKAKMEFLIGAWEPGTIWTDFGVRADIVVRSYVPKILYQIDHSLHNFIAIHPWVPLRWHPRTVNPWFASPSHQGNIQGSYRNMDQRLSFGGTWRSSRPGHNCWHWLSVRHTRCALYAVSLICSYTVSLPCRHSLDYAASQMAEIFSNGLVMTLRPSWR